MNHLVMPLVLCAQVGGNSLFICGYVVWSGEEENCAVVKCLAGP